MNLDEVIADNKKWDLGELIAAFKEIKAAQEAFTAGKKQPPLKTIADVMRKGSFDRLTPEVWERLADLLEGKHRKKDDSLEVLNDIMQGAKGYKEGLKLVKKTRQYKDYTVHNWISQYVADALMEGRTIKPGLVVPRGLITEAVEAYLDQHEKFDESATYRSLSRHKKRLIDEMEKQLSEDKNLIPSYIVE